jgi:hypothetical protein
LVTSIFQTVCFLKLGLIFVDSYESYKREPSQTKKSFDNIALLNKNLFSVGCYVAVLYLTLKVRSCYLVYYIHSKRVVLFIAEICRYLIKAPSLFSPYFLRPKLNRLEWSIWYSVWENCATNIEFRLIYFKL